MKRLGTLLAGLGLIAASGAIFSAQADNKISDPATDQRVLLGTDVVAPVPGVRIEADSKSKVPLIRVATQCPSCYGDFADDFG